MNDQNQQQKFIKEWDDICKMEEEFSIKKRKIMEETEEMAIKKQKIIDEMNNEEIKVTKEMSIKKQRIMDEVMKKMSEKDEKIAKLEKQNHAFKLKMAKMKADLKAQNVSIFRKMPVELMNELFCSLPLENAFGLLVKMPNGLLARNIQKMINSIKMVMKNNKLNVRDSGPRITISDNGLIAIHSGPNGDNCVRTFLPIPSFNLKGIINKPRIDFYFEIQILNKTYQDGSIGIGFCSQEFELEETRLGHRNNFYSIGTYGKRSISINGLRSIIGNANGFFKKNDVIGLGIVHQPNSYFKCFATCNGKLIGMAQMPPKYPNFHIFPVVNLEYDGESIHAIFEKEKWSFKGFERVIE